MMQAYSTLAGVYDRLMQDEYPKWIDYLSLLFKRFSLRSGAVIADIGCGTGAIAHALCGRGFDVLGVDISEEMLEEAAAQLSDCYGRLKLLHQDMRVLTLPGRVDAAICACDGINYLLTERDLQKAFDSIYKALKPGGIFLFDISSEYKLSRMDECFFCEDYDDLAYIWYNSFDPQRRLLTMELSFFLEREDGLFERHEEKHVQCAHTPEKIMDMLERCGFTDVQAFDCFTFEPVREESERIQFAARKTE